MRADTHSTTSENFVVGEITVVFGKTNRKLYKVWWENYPDPKEDTWETEKMLLEDGCREVIDKFWERSDICRTLDFYPDRIRDPDGLNRYWMQARLIDHVVLWREILSQGRIVRGKRMYIIHTYPC